MSGRGQPAKNLLGQTFGSLRVVARAESSARAQARWECECTNCGRKHTAPGDSLRRGRSTGKNCPCRKTYATNADTATLLPIDEKFFRVHRPVIRRAVLKTAGTRLFDSIVDDCIGEVVFKVGVIKQNWTEMDDKRIAAFVYRIAVNVALEEIDHYKLRPLLGGFNSSAEGNEEGGSYEQRLESILSADGDNLDQGHLLRLQAFNELAGDEQDILTARIGHTGRNSDRIKALREKLRARVAVLKVSQGTKKGTR